MPLTPRERGRWLVLADGDFTKRGIERNNQQRIEVEHAAQAARTTLPPLSARADSSQFSGRSH